MRKLILGIFAVVCVQFAFVIYTALQSPLDLAVGPIISEMMTDRNAPGSNEPEVVPVIEESEEKDPVAEPLRKSESPEKYRPGRAASPEYTERSSDRTTSAAVRPNRPDGEFDTLRPAVPDDFETVVISYNRSPEISDCDKFEAPRPKKRSYIAKAAPVIKKPWEWIKAVGSKLN